MAGCGYVAIYKVGTLIKFLSIITSKSQRASELTFFFPIKSSKDELKWPVMGVRGWGGGTLLAPFLY